MIKSPLPTNKPLRSAIAQVIIFVAASTGAVAQVTTNLYYDTNGATNGIGGTGNWTTTGTLWTTNPLGTSTTISGNWVNGAAWSNNLANNAILEETAGTVSLSSGSIYVNQIQINTTGFTIQNSSTGTTSANRYFRTKNGVVLAGSVNLNVSSGVTTNGAVTGFEGRIVGVNGTNSVSTNSSMTITGTTLNADSSVRIGLDSSSSDIWVPVNVTTTGAGYALIRVTGTAQPTIYGDITVSSNSRLVLGGDASARRLNIKGNLTTANTDLTIGEVGMTGVVVLYGTNSIAGNVVANCALGFGSTNALGTSTVVLKSGSGIGATSFGTDASDRTLANSLSVQGDVVFGLNGLAGFTTGAGSYLGGNVDLNNATRTFTITNTTYFFGAITNGGIKLSAGSPTVTAYLNGTNSLTSLSLSNGTVAFNPASHQIGTFTMNGQATAFTTNATNSSIITTNYFFPTLLIQSPTTNDSISTGGALVFSGTNNTISFTNNNLAPGTYTLLKGTSLNLSSLSTNGLALKVIVPITDTNTTSYPVALNAAPVTWQRYIYTFSNTATSLVATLSATSPDLAWSVATGNWNTNTTNQPWVLDGSSVAFETGDNVVIAAGGTLNVDPSGVSAGYVTISGSSNVTIQGGALTALAITKDGSGTSTLSNAGTLSQGLTVSNGVLIVSGVLNYTNETLIAGGVLQTSGNERIPDSSTVRLSAAEATLKLGGNETVRAVEGVSNSVVDLPAGRTLTLNSAGSSAGSTNYVNITGGGSLVKIGTNQVSFRGNNSLDSLTVSSGRADLRGSNTINSINVSAGALLGYGATNRALGDAVITLENGASIGQIISMGTNDVDRTMANALIVNGDINVGIGSYGCYFSGNANLRGSSRALTLVNSTYFYGGMTNGNLVVDISSTSTNSKTLYLWGSNQFSAGVTLRPTFTGYPLILSIGGGNALGGGSLSLAGSATVTVSNSLTLTNPISLASEAVIIMDPGARTWTQNGAISGSGSLTKAGNGTLILGTANSHLGVNALSAGTLLLGNAEALGSSINMLNLGGGTLALGQSSGDVVAGDTTVSSNSILDLGSGAPSRTIRFAGLSFSSTNNILTVSNTANGNVYLPTSFDTNALAQIGSAENPTFTASINPTNGLLSFSGGVTPPSNLSYTPSSQTCTVGTAIANMTPTITGDIVTNYSVSPVLPGGLSINASSGVISGTPTTVTSSAPYTVTAANEAGSTNAVVTIAVQSAYTAWSQGAPLNSTNQLAYAIGGATSPTATNGVASTTSLTSSNLSITAIVRTNDTNLAVFGQSITNLALGTWITNDVSMAVPSDQAGATPGTTQRRTFSTLRSTNDSKKFLRLNTTLTNQ
jgi:hypothetical protein